jgi:nucleotide-binding universal stress UspA family protein
MPTETRSGPPTLVFGDDASSAAGLAWTWVTDQPWPGWAVRVVHAVEPDLVHPAPPDVAALHPWQPPHPRVAPAGTGIAALTHLTATRDPRLVLGEPADLVVIGPRGHGTWEALHLGSTAEWLLQAPRTPTVCVRAAGPVRQVLACVDGSVHAERAVAALAALPLVDGAEVVLLAVADGRTDPGHAIGRAEGLLAGTGARVGAVEAAGRAAAVLLDEIARRGPDLVVLGTRGLSGWSRLRTGSTASTVLRRSATTLLVAHDTSVD